MLVAANYPACEPGLLFLECEPLPEWQRGTGDRVIENDNSEKSGVHDPLINGSPGMKWPSPAMSGDEWR